LFDWQLLHISVKIILDAAEVALLDILLFRGWLVWRM